MLIAVRSNTTETKNFLIYYFIPMTLLVPFEPLIMQKRGTAMPRSELEVVGKAAAEAVAEPETHEDEAAAGVAHYGHPLSQPHGRYHESDYALEIQIIVALHGTKALDAAGPHYISHH